MYHALMLYRLMDCINLAQANPICIGTDLLTVFKEKANAMLGWLHEIAWQDGSTAHINDSANDIAPALHSLDLYALRLGIAISNNKLKESGYRKYRAAQYELLADVGKIGPDYIPGHAHSDSLSFVMQVDAKPFIVDTGISTYEKNKTRQWERSTAAHNTIQLDDWEQSEVWGGFRVARRASTAILEENPDVLVASHDGYSRKGGQHQRIWKFSAESVKVEDNVVAPNGVQAKAYFHFSPDVTLESKENNSIVLTNLWCLKFEGANQIDIGEYQCAGQYNRTNLAKKLTVYFTNHLQTTISK
jgi:uncharacterized heparinase superfamily protein